MTNDRQKEQAEIMRRLIAFYREPAILLIKHLLKHNILTKSEIASILDVDISAIDKVYLDKGVKRTIGEVKLNNFKAYEQRLRDS